ncbi:MAG: hypothetical protein SGBAC_010801 [Bacillariaceae sp.]
MAGEIQKASPPMDDSEVSNPLTSDKEASIKAQTSAVSAGSDKANCEEKKQLQESQSRDESEALDSMQSQEQDKIESNGSKDEGSAASETTAEAEAETNHKAAPSDYAESASSSLPPSASPLPSPSKEESTPFVETVTSMDSMRLFGAHAKSKAEPIDAAKSSETAVNISEDPTPVVVEAVAVDDDQEARPSFASRAAAAAATAATGISASLSNLSASPKSSPRASPAASPARSTASNSGQATPTASPIDKPSLAARAAAAAAAAAEASGIMPALSNLSGTPRTSPRGSPARSPLSAARTWPDEAANADDTFFDNGEVIPGSLPSPPRSEVGASTIGGQVMPFTLPTTAAPASSSPPRSEVDTAITAPSVSTGPVDLDDFAGTPSTSPVAAEDDNPTVGIDDTNSNSNNSKKEAQVLSVVPTMVEDKYEAKELDAMEENKTREVASPPEERAHNAQENNVGSNNRVAALKAGLKTKKGKAILAAIVIVVIAIGVGIGLALSPSEPSYCNAVRSGAPIPNEGDYQQLDLNWIIDVATFDKWESSLIDDIKRDFQSILFPIMAGCKGSFIEDEDDARVVNGYVVRTRDTGDCRGNFPQPCFNILVDFAIWVKPGSYANPLETMSYLEDTFGAVVTDQIETHSIVRTSQLVLLEQVVS